MNQKIKIISALLLIGGLLLVSGCGCKQKTGANYKVSLEVWGILDDSAAFQSIFDNFKKIDPNVSSITYKKFDSATYRQELINALASGQGPDIFVINNTWLPSFEDKLVAAPANNPQVLSLKKFQDNFVDVTAADFVDKNQIYATPLSVDSLALYYNKDLLNQAGITAPPATWGDFESDVQKMTQIDSFGNITQSGAAAGTAYNINRSTDILNLLMMQEGTQMVDSNNQPIFDSYITEPDGQNVSPAQSALDFYTQFSTAGSLYYTWNPILHYSIDAFSEGTTAMMINYSWQMATINSEAPKLNYGVAPIPQFQNGTKLDYASYWGYAVAKNKIPASSSYGVPNAAPTATDAERVTEAWKLLTYLTTKPDGTFIGSGGGMGQQANNKLDPAVQYLKATNQPAARRDLVQAQLNDPEMAPFAAGNLIDKSWRESDPNSIEAIFASMIDQVNKGQTTTSDAIQAAAQRVRQLTSNSTVSNQ
ncbi:MAG: extracellular solute-binding protein [Candidatus Pacebacteria bacterium]|nr:extracellular solute-binding protein [Candidatus Paceibacterota bacterium]